MHDRSHKSGSRRAQFGLPDPALWLPFVRNRIGPVLIRLLHLLLLPIAFHLTAERLTAADQWRTLAIRVSFPQEDPDNPTTSGDGTFDMRPLETARPDYRFLYDTPPHDGAYFEAHLTALANYYRTVSDGQVEITYEVWPKDLNESYRLPRTLLSYGSGRTRDEIASRITELFRDGIVAADSTEKGELDFSGFRSYIVFHAGIGAEARSGRTFNDVASAFVDENDLQSHLGGAIPVQNGSHLVANGMLLPEAISTDGRGGLNGTLARFFGSQLGLPGLSNFKDDLPAAGGWSLMDVGSNRIIGKEIAERLPGFLRDGTGLVGFAPVFPEAWSRVRLGWISPLTVSRDTTIEIGAADIRSGLPRVVKVPITSDEYFLLENRESRLMRGETPTVVFSRGDSGGVWVSREHYDAFIPGSGLLIWHVDESVIRGADQERGVNDDPHRRGLRLVEADGYFDIGNIFVPFDRVDQIEGGPDDPFYVGGKGISFGPTTIPDSRSNAGYHTGIQITVQSPPGDTMAVSVSFERTGGRWPVTGLPAFGRNAARVIDLDGDGIKEVVATTLDGLLLAFRADGQPFGADPQGLWAETGDSTIFTPAVGDLDGDGTQDLVTAGSSGLITARSGRGLLWSVRLDRPPSTPPTIADLGLGSSVLLGGGGGELISLQGQNGRVTGLDEPVAESSVAGLAVGDLDGDGTPEVVLIGSEGGVYRVGSDGSRLIDRVPGRVSLPPVLADLDGDKAAEVVVITDGGEVFYLRQGRVVPTDSGGGFRSGAAVADVDGDGFLEVASGGSGLQILRHNGVAQVGSPFNLPVKDRATEIMAPPVIGDLDKDGRPDLVFSAGGYLYGLRGDGNPLPGFPLATLGPIVASPLLEDLEGDGGLDLIAVTSPGGISLWDLIRLDEDLNGESVQWGQEGGGPGNRNAALTKQAPGPGPSDSFLPAERVYCYPNPIVGGGARLRFFLGREARIEVKIFNTSADLVGSMSLANPLPGTDNEIVWDTSGYATGLYICRVEATDRGGQKEVRFVKAAVK